MKRLFSIIQRTILICIASVIGLKICTVFSNDSVKAMNELTETKGCISLNYHRVLDNNIYYSILEILSQSKELTTYSVFQADFESQMTYLKDNGAYFATNDDLITFKNKKNYPDKCVHISFDDADITTYENAYPILKELNIPAAIYVVTKYIGTNDFNNLEIIDENQIKEMYDSGLITYGVHTHDMHKLEDGKAMFLHPHHYDTLSEDIKKSKIILEKILESPVNTIAYPFGETNDDVTEIVKESGFEMAFLLSPNPNHAETDNFYMNRYVASRDVFNDVIKPWIENYETFK